MTKPIRVQMTRKTDMYPKGAELGFDSEAKATSVPGEGTFKVLSYQDGQPVPEPKSPPKADSKGEK